VQRSRHVDAGAIVVEATDADIARLGVGADVPLERAQRHAALLADGAPALDADVAG